MFTYEDYLAILETHQRAEKLGGAFVGQPDEIDRGHRNSAGGYCCPHHGDTCGFCHQYD